MCAQCGRRYFLPALIALWPTCLHPKRRHIVEAVMVLVRREFRGQPSLP